MKKLAIIASSAALAALPVVGVFAEDDTSAEDTVTVTVAETCTFANESGAGTSTATANLSAGEKKEDMAGSKLIINCNASGGWDLKVKSSDGTANLVGADAGSSKPIATGKTFSGATSAWAMKLTASAGAPQDSFDEFHVIPTTDTVAVKSTTATDETSIQATYGVYVSGDQPADTYTGKVTYTLSHPASS